METQTQKQNKQDVHILNDLVQINTDRITGYEKAIKGLEGGNVRLAETYSRMISQSQEIKNELQKFISQFGGEVSERITVPGALYQAWMDIKDTFSTRTDLSTIELCHFGEDAAQKTYKKALESKELSPEFRQIVSNQMWELKTSHDEIKALRDQLEPTPH